MANLNKVFLIGNLTRDPELRVTPRGTPICQFGLAISRQFKDESGQTREEATFVDVEAWGKQGETISKYVTKGRPLFVEGRLKFDQWEDKTTQQKRSKLKVVLENFQFLGGREGGPGGPAGGAPGAGAGAEDYGVDQTVERHSPPPRTPTRSAAPATPLPPADIADDDVPF
ncbi:single-stranded DNA-binding protein [Opitutaceae bacterium TAV4]|uniref:single-stranded DNA-binding protein n=1 Tax=Geminisphaera colitermitum TaxID=1148786 RepID=UPI000158CC55|nr:single-stranded DNA-binding protein [Geminisphaera colitermitum]RRJ95900.1 single-stranded DNA-binding protein [Opitutaceae bacterium TAV4]RRK00053.1 single-stranded DNA-binding protein [Opitutaceae bacterium TAV3]